MTGRTSAHEVDAPHDEAATGARTGAKGGKRKRARRARSPHPGVKLKRRTWTRPDGSTGTAWVARYVDPDTGRSKDETLEAAHLRTHEARVAWARKKADTLAERRAELASGKPRHTGTTLRAALDDYLAVVTAQKRAKTVENYRPAVARFLAWADKRGLASTDDVRPHDLAVYREELAGARRAVVAKGTGAGRGSRAPGANRLSPASVNCYLRPVKAALNYLRRVALLPHVSTEELKDALRPVREPKPEPRILDRSEVAALLAACQRHDAERFALTRREHDGWGAAGSTPRYTPVAPFVAFLLLSGLRLNEALELTWAAVDFDALDDDGQEVGALRVSGKGGDRRTVGLEVSPGLRRILQALRVRSGGTGRVFDAITEGVAKASLRRLVSGGASPSASTKKGARSRKREGYGAPRFGWHDLRRTCGTYLVCAPGIFGAASVFLAARQLGHSVAVAERFYLGRVRGLPREARTLDDALGIGDALEQITRAVLGDAPPDVDDAPHAVASA